MFSRTSLVLLRLVLKVERTYKLEIQISGNEELCQQSITLAVTSLKLCLVLLQILFKQSLSYSRRQLINLVSQRQKIAQFSLM